MPTGRRNRTELDGETGIIDEKRKLLMTGQSMTVDLATIEGRNAARMYAYSVLADDPELAKIILGIVGKEG